MPIDDRDWSKIIPAAKDEYFRYRSSGHDETTSLLAAIKVAIAEAEKRK